MELGDIWLKVARNQALTPQEEEFLRIEGRNTQMRNQFVAGNTTADGKLMLSLPFEVIYSEILQTAKASITIPIPSKYKHLIINGSGGVDVANGGNIWAQFNGDTGNNYSWQFVKAANTTISGTRDTSDPYAVLGVFGTTGAGVGVNGSFSADIQNYISTTLNKNVISRIFASEFNDLYLAGSTWANVNPIQSIEIFGTNNTLAKGTANISAGSTISVYGII